jgi:hypothetical protein
MHPPLVFIDTLAVWAGIADENDASKATLALAPVMLLAANTGAGIVVVHHTRKGGGSGGEAIRGSGAIYASVDMSVELSVVSEDSDDRWLDVTGRVVHPTRLRLGFDRETMTYEVVDRREEEDEADLEGVPEDGPGWSQAQLGRHWGLANPRNRIARLLASGKLRRATNPGGGWLHWKVGPRWRTASAEEEE